VVQGERDPTPQKNEAGAEQYGAKGDEEGFHGWASLLAARKLQEAMSEKG
jgi:hypothetical protein